MTPFHHATATEPARVFIIAELGVNHDGSLDRALQLVEAAAEAGADAVKLQLFNPDTLLSAQAQLAGYQQRDGNQSIHELLAGLVLSPEEVAAVADAANRLDLRFILTPFSLEDVPTLAELSPDFIKIASPDAVNTPLLTACAALDLPMIVSTGACDPEELDTAAGLAVCLLQCVSRYPTPQADAALGGIVALRERYPRLPVGYSDHTTGEHTGSCAVLAGACVLEKHLTHNRYAPGPDHAVSLDAKGFARYVKQAREAVLMLGRLAKRCGEDEQEVRSLCRQSVVAARDLTPGRPLVRDDVRLSRPGTGIPARDLEGTLGRRLTLAVAAGEPIQPEALAV